MQMLRLRSPGSHRKWVNQWAWVCCLQTQVAGGALELGRWFVNSGLEVGFAVAPPLPQLPWTGWQVVLEIYFSHARRGQGWACRVALCSEGSR